MLQNNYKISHLMIFLTILKKEKFDMLSKYSYPNLIHIQHSQGGPTTYENRFFRRKNYRR